MSIGPVAAFFSSCTWAIGSATFSRLSRTYSPFSINFTRAMTSLPCFLLVFILVSGGVGPAIDSYRSLPIEKFGWFTLSIFCSYALGDVFFLWSTQRLGITTSLAIASSYPIITALFHVLTGGTVNGLQALGLVCAVGGVVGVILTNHQNAQEKRFGSPAIGVLFAMMTAGFWALNAWSVMRGGEGLDAAQANSIRMSVALVMSSLFCLVIEKRLPKPVPWSELKKTGWIFWLESFGGSYLYVYGLSHSSVVVGTTLSSLAPVVVVPVAVLMRIEKFSMKRTAAVALTVLGVFLLNQGVAS